MAVTSNLGATLLEVGQTQKEPTINELANLFDAAIAGYLTKSVAGSANVTLTSTEARNPILVFTGALTGNIFVDIPATGRLRAYTVFNNTTGAFTLTMRYNGAGTTVLIPQGQRKEIYHDGTNVLEVQTSSPAARVKHSANQSIANNTLTALAFDQERFDTETIHDTSSNNSRLTCKTAGKYLITATVSFDANVTGRRDILIRLNGTTVIAMHNEMPVTEASVPTILSVSTVYLLAVGDYVEVLVIQNSGGALNVLATDNYSPEFSMVRVG